MDLEVTVIGDRSLAQNLDQMPAAVRAILAIKVETWTGELATLVERAIDDNFNIKTGRLISAVETEVDENGDRVEGRVVIRNVPYARILDQGGVIPPHIIRPKNAKILAFMGASGQKVFATQVLHPGATIRAANYMADAKRQISAQVSRGLKSAVVQGIRETMRNG